ncbi:MAG: hypothetical protein JWN40_4757 [Phycisphaerales bacterium]|nr:hypothetical protein [Phycisphaerales bacterium]
MRPCRLRRGSDSARRARRAWPNRGAPKSPRRGVRWPRRSARQRGRGRRNPSGRRRGTCNDYRTRGAGDLIGGKRIAWFGGVERTILFSGRGWQSGYGFSGSRGGGGKVMPFRLLFDAFSQPFQCLLVGFSMPFRCRKIAFVALFSGWSLMVDLVVKERSVLYRAGVGDGAKSVEEWGEFRQASTASVLVRRSLGSDLARSKPGPPSRVSVAWSTAKIWSLPASPKT